MLNLGEIFLFGCLICCLQCRGPLSTSSPLPSILPVLGSPNRTAVWELPFSLPAWHATLPQYSRHGGTHADGMGGKRRRQDPGKTRNGGRKSPVPSGMGKCERVLRTCTRQRKRKGLETSRCIIRVCMVTSRSVKASMSRWVFGGREKKTTSSKSRLSYTAASLWDYTVKIS